MSSESGSGESNSKSGSESEADEEEVTVLGAKSPKAMQEAGPSNAAASMEERVKKGAEKSSNDVVDKNATVNDQGRAVEHHPKPAGRGVSRVTQTDDSVKNTANVAVKVTPTEVIFFWVIFP
jgi:hypothetical protein